MTRPKPKHTSDYDDHAALVRIAWWDASHHDYDDGDLTNDMEVGVMRYTVGYAVRDDDTGIVLAMDLTEGDYRMGFTIPRAYVVDVECVKEASYG